MALKTDTLGMGEWLPDQPEMNSQGVQIARNVIASVNSYKPFSAVETFSTAVPTASSDWLRGAIALRDDDMVSYIYAGDASRLYELSATSFEDVSKSGAYSGTSTDNVWNMAQWGNTVIATNFNNNPQQMTLGGAAFADLAGSPPRAKYLGIVRDFVVLANTAEGVNNYPRRVQWSAFNNATLWTPNVTTQSDFQDIPDGGGITGFVGGQVGAVFQESQITLMTYEGPPRIFRFDVVEKKRGCSVPGTIIRYGQTIYYLSDDDFYAMPIGGTPQPMGQEKVVDYFYRNFDETFSERVFAGIDIRRKLVMWAYPSNNANNGQPDRVLVYSISTNRFTEIENEYGRFLVGIGIGYDMDSLDSINTNLDLIDVSLDDPFYTGGRPRPAAFTLSKKLGFFTGTALSAQVETKERNFRPNQLMEINNLRPLVEGENTNVSVKIGTRNKLSDAVTYTDSIPVNSYGECNTRLNARYARAVIETSGNYTLISGVEVEHKAGGRRG